MQLQTANFKADTGLSVRMAKVLLKKFSNGTKFHSATQTTVKVS